MVIDGLSPDGLATAEYARFRNFLFDAEFVPMRAAKTDRPQPNIVYTRSSLLQDAALAGVAGANFVSMECLGNLGRFGNQVWQYLFVRLYGLRNGLAVRVPAWEGEKVFGFTDERPAPGQKRAQLNFPGVGDVDLELWEVEDAPRDIDFNGHFQNVPPQWRVHRDFVRTMFKLRADWLAAVGALTRSLAADARTLVTVHVRRGDYKRGQHVDPLFRLAPVGWYVKLLDEIWPRLSRPILHVSTDEPRAIRPQFQKFEQLDAGILLRGNPAHVLDFVLLQEADYLVACNSSFSTAAALLGKRGQTCYIVDFDCESVVPYEPWNEVSFAHRFVRESRTIAAPGYGLHGARRRVLAMGPQVAAKAKLEAELEELRDRISSLENDARWPGKLFVRRILRAVRNFGDR